MEANNDIGEERFFFQIDDLSRKKWQTKEDMVGSSKNKYEEVYLYEDSPSDRLE